MSKTKYCIGIAVTTAALALRGVGAAGELPDGAQVVVPPLTQAMWNQGRHYNRMCPLGLATNPDGRRYAGCTAVATAIVLDYYQWPPQGTGDTTYNEAYWPSDSINLRARFDLPYDWEGMRGEYGHVVSARASRAIATLMSDVGAVLNMNYGTSGSSTQFDQIGGALGRHFFFDNSYAPTIRTFDDEGQSAVQLQLMAGHPILCSGAANAEGVGHTYVCDGFATTDERQGAVTNLYHFNFGWGGTNNGWYPLDAVFTSAIPGEAPTSQRVDEMLLGVFPERAPLFVRRPEVAGPDLEVAWSVATCWTNYLDGLVLERQRLQRTAVNTAVQPTDWTMHMMGTDPCGWIVGGGVVSGRVYQWGSWGDKYWPGMGNCIGLPKGIAVSHDTTVTIAYQAVKLPNGVSLKLTTCRHDPDTDEWLDVDASWRPFPTIATLPCGSSSSLESKTVTVSGAELVAALGGTSAEVHFAINIDDPNYVSPTFAGNTEIFRLESFTVSGEAEDWTTVETRELASDVRSAGFTDLEEGDHRFVLTAQYADGGASRTSMQRISSTLKVPTVQVAETNASGVTFEISDADDFACDFEKQSNSLKGTPTRNGNRVTYVFEKPVAQLGTHWLTLTVSNRVNGLTAKCVHITNPPQDHPLADSAEPTIAAAAARAKREGKQVLVFSSGDPDGKLAKLPGVLTADNVVEAVREGFVLVECLATTSAGQSLSQQYWRPQPRWDYDLADVFAPLRKAYLYVVDPSQPDAPGPTDTRLSGMTAYMSAAARWNYLNTQLDIANVVSETAAAADVVRFLGQDFVVAVPDVVELASDGTLTNIFGYAAESIRVVHTATEGGVTKTYDITSAFAKTGDATHGVTLKLLGSNAVTVASEVITVTPVMAACPDDDSVSETPFAVSSSEAVVGIKTIPGLKYALMRGSTPEAATKGDVVDERVAEGPRLRLSDPKRPATRAFYAVRVCAP